jgi:hypothetical protein
MISVADTMHHFTTCLLHIVMIDENKQQQIPYEIYERTNFQIGRYTINESDHVFRKGLSYIIP